MKEGCVDPGQAEIPLDGDTWSTEYMESTTVTIVNMKPNLSEAQRLSVTADDPAPFYDWSAPWFKINPRKKRRSCKVSKGQRSSGGSGGYEAQTHDDGNSGK